MAYQDNSFTQLQKTSVELKLTYKILGKDENIRREGAQESRTQSQTKKSQIAFIQA